MIIKKKLKDVTLAEVRRICRESQAACGCTICPFDKLIFHDLPNNTEYNYCPFEEDLPEELEEKEIYLEINDFPERQ